MKSIAVACSALLALAALGSSATASAELGKGSDKSTGGGAPASGGGAGGGGGGDTPQPTSRDTTSGSSPEAARDPAKKIWEVGIGAEYHRLFIQNDLEGAAANKNLMVYSAYVEVDPTPNDRIKLRSFLYERFLADPGETGLRTDDLILQYTHYFKLPWQMVLKPGAWITAPTSFTSQIASEITAPRLYVALDKTFGKYVHVEPRVAADYYIMQYGSVTNGSTPNAQADFRLGINAEVDMPFHPQLTFGVDAGTAYYWYYKARAAQAGSDNPDFAGTVQDSTYTGTQPIQQTYGYEAYLRYDFSRFKPEKWNGLHRDFTLSAANGDPSIGYPSAIHDGSLAIYWGFRNNEEVYGVLSARY